jgi:acyl-CoA synthetase (AMP-forming)/AMP-acid ligase II
MTAGPHAGVDCWGAAIEQEAVRGVLFRTYAQRPRNLSSLLDFALRWGDRPHLVQGGEIVTFHDLYDAVLAKARQLAERGTKPGDRVLLFGFNSADWIINFWSILEVGAVPVLGNAWWAAHEVDDLVPRLDVALALAHPRLASRLPASLGLGPWECPRPDTRPERMSPAQSSAGEDAPAVIIFTSGTSGRSKAVVLSHRAVLAGLQMLLHITKRLPHQVVESTGDTALHTGPMFHVGGVQTLIRAVTVGDTLVMPRGRFDAGEALELIEEWRVARWSAVPTMVSRLLEHVDVRIRDLSSLRSVTVGGAPVTAQFIEKLRKGLPSVEPRVPTGYGLTENGGQATAASGRDSVERPGTCGRPLPLVEISILGPDAEGQGEVLIKAPTQMLGYLGEAESPVDPDGWLHTGDLGKVDADGYLWITGRSKDVIIRGGENIAPVAIEQALAGAPGVVESAVFGVPHEDLGEEVMAVVTVEPGTTIESLEAHVRARLASFAVPSRWRLASEPLPTNHSGKIDKNALRAEAVASLS